MVPFEEERLYLFPCVALGGSVHSKIGVCGDSAGGKLAAVACHEQKNIVQFAVSMTLKTYC